MYPQPDGGGKSFLKGVGRPEILYCRPEWAEVMQNEKTNKYIIRGLCPLKVLHHDLFSSDLAG